MPDPYELDDEGRPVAEKRDEEEVDRAEKAEEAAAEPTVDAGETAESDTSAGTEPNADPELIAGTESSAENGLVAGTEPVAEGAPAADPTAQAASMRRQIETTLRFMRLQTAVGVIVILGLIAFMSDIRGVLVLVLIIFTFSSLGAYWWLRRNLNARLGGLGGGRQS